MKNQLKLNEIKALAIDMDGVLWHGDIPLPGLAKFFHFIDEVSIPYVLASNNSSKTPAQYQTKLAKFGVTIRPQNVLTSSLATAAYLTNVLDHGSPLYVVGQDGLREAVTEAGFVIMPDASQPVAAVVSGLDFNVNYEILKQATLAIQRGAQFIGTNGDLTFPSEEGLLPGTGAILVAIEAATGVKPITIGKPEPLMFEIAVQKLGSRPDETAILGDRLSTDILGGQQAGLRTIFVTSGIDDQAGIEQQGIRPDLIFSGIDELVDVWQQQTA